MAKFPSSTGSIRKGKGGTGKTVDHPGMGTCPKGANNKTLANTSHAGGKAIKSYGPGAGKASPNPNPKCYAQGPQGKQGGGF